MFKKYLYQITSYLMLGEKKKMAMSKKTEQIRKYIQGREAKVEVKTKELLEKSNVIYYLEKEKENLKQEGKRQKNLNAFRTFLNDNPHNQHGAIKELYTNEDGRLIEYIKAKIIDLEKRDHFEEFRQFFKTVFTGIVLSSREISQVEIAEINQKCMENTKVISVKFKVHFDVFNEIIKSLSKIFKLETVDSLLLQVADILEISKDKLSERIRFNKNSRADKILLNNASVIDITLIEDKSSNAQEEIKNSGRGDMKFKRLIDEMMTGNLTFVTSANNVETQVQNSIPSFDNLPKEEFKQYTLKNNSGGGNCAVYAICDALNLSLDDAKNIRREICEIVLACARLEEADTNTLKVEFKQIFNENFEIFKSVANHFYAQSISNSDTNEETRLNLICQQRRLVDSLDWENILNENWQSIFNTVRFGDVQFRAILDDHMVDEGNYPEYVLRDGVWLNNHEISAFLLRKGYLFDGIEDRRINNLGGTILKYKNAYTQDNIYMHNNGVDTGVRTVASGNHWQAAIQQIKTRHTGVGINKIQETTYSKIAEDIGNNNEIKLKRLLNKYQEIEKEYKAKYQNYTKRQIREYGESTRNGRIEYEELSAVAVVMRANEIATGNSLRYVQILAILEFLDEDTNKFCQIKTGEGKTAISSALAVIRSLQGNAVDIITSNSVLAEDAVKVRKQFYQLFGITVTHNNPDIKNPYIDGIKPCYTQDIVYGTIGAFAFDYLHNNVEALGTKVLAIRDGIPVSRECNTVIVDEVDNVILDNYSIFTNQAKSVAGIDYVKFVYFDIWQNVIKVEQELGIDQSKVTDDVKGTIKKKINIKELEQKVKANKSLSGCFQEFICRKLELLVDNAIKSKYDLHEDEDYVISSKDNEDNILPLEKEIGVRLQNFIWTDLHPFIQMKHNLHVNSCGSLTSVFIPNCVYLKLYKKIYGLTGTLGSQKERQFIYDIYDAQSTIIPPFTPSKKEDLGKRIVSNERKWLESIADVAKKCSTRAVLFVCDTPKALKKIEQKLKENGFTNIVTYANENDAHKIESINCKGGAIVGTIIISTNIGGRGTDILLSTEVALNGGLHQCTTYLPKNIRTEKQAAGRAARSGQTGSAEIIFQRRELEELKKLKPDLLQADGQDDISYALRLRDMIEEGRLKKATAHVKTILCNYQLFKKFENYYYFLKKYRNINNFILEDLKFKFALRYDKGDERELQEFFEEIDLDTTNSCTQYRFVNPYLTVKYAQSLLCVGEFDVAEQVLSSTHTDEEHSKVAVRNYASQELLSIPAYYLTMFEIVLNKNLNIFYRLLSPIINLIPENSSENEENKGIAKTYLEKAIKNLQNNVDDIIGLIESSDFRAICLNKDNLHNFGENMMLQHLESEQAVIVNTMIHISKLKKFIEENIVPAKRIYVKKTYQFEQIKENGLKVDLNIDGISSAEIVLADKVGLGIFYELDVLAQINSENPDVNKANLKIASGIAMLSTAYIPEVGLIMAPALSIPAGKLIRSGIKKILSIAFNDPEIYNEVEDLEEYVLDVITSFGGPATTLPKILKVVLMEVGQSLLLKHLIRTFGDEILGYVKPIIEPITQLIRGSITSICEIKEYIYNKLKNVLLDPIKEYLQQFIGQAKKLFSQINTEDLHTQENQDLIIIPMVEEANSEFQSIINDIIDVKCTILKFCEEGYEVFNQFKRVKNKFPKLCGNIIRQIKDFVKLIRDFINGALSDSIKVITQKAGNIVNGIINLIPQYIGTITVKVSKIIDKVKRIINAIISNPRQLLTELYNFIRYNIIEKIHEILTELTNSLVQKVEGIFDLILRNNPIDKYLAKNGIDLSKPETVIDKLSSFAVDQILKFIKSLILQPQQQDANVTELDNSETTSNIPQPTNQNCVPRALTRLLHLDNQDELLHVTRAYIGEKIIKDSGLTRWETKFILEDLGLKVVEQNTNGQFHELAIVSLKYYRSIGAVGLFVRCDSSGHAYYISKHGNGVQFIDDDHVNCEVSAQVLADYTEGYILIPMNFSEQQIEFVKKRIRENPHPNDAFSLVYIIRQIWERLFPGQTFGLSRLDGEYYPSGPLRIRADNKLLKKILIDKFYVRLSKAQKRRVIYNSKNETPENVKLRGDTIPAFGIINNEKKENESRKDKIMMGALSVQFSDNENNKSTFKRIALSGSGKFGIRQNVLNPKNDWEKRIYEAQNMRNIDDFEFVHSELTGKKIYDVRHCQEQNHTHNSDCAAQQLLYALGEHMKKFPKLFIVGEIRMAEGYYDIEKKPYMVASCEKCEEVLPLATGASCEDVKCEVCKEKKFKLKGKNIGMKTYGGNRNNE